MDNQFLFIFVTLIFPWAIYHPVLIIIDSSQIPLCTPQGVSLSAHTIYLVECAPKRLRGMVGVTVATFISLGKFCGQLLGIR